MTRLAESGFRRDDGVAQSGFRRDNGKNEFRTFHESIEIELQAI